MGDDLLPEPPCWLCEGEASMPVLNPETLHVVSIPCPHCKGTGHEPPLTAEQMEERGQVALEGL